MSHEPSLPPPVTAGLESGSEPPPAACTRCGTAGTGRFCAECGAPLAGAPCPACEATLTPGARFCHRCGAPAGGGRAGQSGAPAAPAVTGTSGEPRRTGTLATNLPWAVAGIAFLALFAMLAGKGFNARRGASLDAPLNALPNPALDNGGPAAAQGGAGGDQLAAPFAAAAGGGVRAPDISRMTPQELAERLYNRIMTLDAEGKSDSVQFFAPMAIQAYQMVRDQQGRAFDADQRYDVGRIALVAGAFPMARAQADTILQQQPTNLLGLLLAAQTARGSGNPTAEREYLAQLRRARSTELARNAQAYSRHQREIDAVR